MSCKYVFKRDLDDDSDGAHLTSFGIEFQTEEKAKKTSDHKALPYCVQVYYRRGMVCELKRVLRVCDGFYAACL